MAFAGQWGIFDRLGGGSNIELNIQSRDMDAMLSTARFGMDLVARTLAGRAGAARSRGSILPSPNYALFPTNVALLKPVGTRRQMSTVMRALGDGVYVGDYFDGDNRMDIVLRAPEWSSPEQLASTPLATPAGRHSVNRSTGPHAKNSRAGSNSTC